MTELDEALSRFHELSPIWGGELANHGPMACETLEELGHSALIPAMVDRYAPRVPLMLKGKPLQKESARDSLGHSDLVADWIATFEERLSKEPWYDVLLSALGLLCDGLFGAGGHGYLRTAHAVRALKKRDTECRRRELAHGLGYWAATYQVLPGEPGKNSRGSFKNALESLRSPSAFDSDQLFTRSVDGFTQLGSFREAVAWPSFSSENAIADSYEMIRIAANCFQNTDSGWLAAAHGITTASAIRLFGLDSKDAILMKLTRRAWQVCLCFYALCPKNRIPEKNGNQVKSKLYKSVEEIGYLAACSLDEHIIKLTEACIREFNLGGDEILLEIASRAVTNLETKGLRVC